jgi:hypothetical protein
VSKTRPPTITIVPVRRAVVHINLDPDGVLSAAQLDGAVAALRRAGFEVIATELERLPPTRREVEVLCSGDDIAALRQWAQTSCAAALAASAVFVRPRVVAASFISRGSREDALGIVEALGSGLDVEEIEFVGDDIAVLVLADGDAVPERLQTALESALNREVRLSLPPV